MRKSVRPARPICVACNRPFDPTSPGATINMGPTCAKKAGLSPLAISSGSAAAINLTLALFDAAPAGTEHDEHEIQLSPRLKAEQEERNLADQVRVASAKLPTRKVPKQLREGYILAKIAFDDLLREFLPIQKMARGDEAFALYQDLKRAKVDEFSFGDPSLKWLEPEHDVHLLFDRQADKAFYWRIFNGTYTLLEIEPGHSPEARRNISTIVAYCEALAAQRRIEATHQLSLIEFTDDDSNETSAI